MSKKKLHYKVRQKIVKLVKSKNYFQLGYYLFELIFRDNRVKDKRDKFIGITPQKTEKLMERRFPPNTSDKTIEEECYTFIQRSIELIDRGQLEP